VKVVETIVNPVQVIHDGANAATNGKNNKKNHNKNKKPTNTHKVITLVKGKKNAAAASAIGGLVSMFVGAVVGALLTL
jgi:hypothetical protein